MEKPITLEEVEAIPKVDLHCHLDGSLTAEGIWTVAQKHGITVPDLPEQTLDALKKVYPDPGPFHAEQPKEFDRFLKLFGRAFSVMLTPETIYDSTMEVIRNLKRQNIIYAELRFAPNYHTVLGFSMSEITEAVLKAMKDAEIETGVMTKLIIGIPREIAYNPDYKGPTPDQIVDTALEFQNQGVVAVDLTCSEHFGPEPYVEAFRKTFNSKLSRTVHAGETGPKMEQNIWTALRDMQTDGIGHARPLRRMPEAMELIKLLSVRIERCPISNQCMSVGDGFDNIDYLLREGFLVTVNSDDPGIFGPTCSLSNNLLTVANKYQLGMNGIYTLTRLGIGSAFCGDGEKNRIMDRFEDLTGFVPSI